MSNTRNELENKVRKLRKQVAKNESKGNFNTAHHAQLVAYEARLEKPRKPAESVKSQKHHEDVMEDVEDGE